MREAESIVEMCAVVVVVAGDGTGAAVVVAVCEGFAVVGSRMCQFVEALRDLHAQIDERNYIFFSGADISSYNASITKSTQQMSGVEH